MKPRILIDARMVGPVGHGIARYVNAIARALKDLDDRSKLPYEPVFIVSSPSIAFDGFETIRSHVPFLDPREMLILPKLLQRARAALYHSPSFSSLIRCPCPWVVTVHDLIHLRYGGVAQKLYYRAVLRPFARKAKRVMTVSEFSKREIEAWGGLADGNISVVHNVVDPPQPGALSTDRVKSLLARLGLESERYFSCLAPLKPHKNLEMLIRAYLVYRYECQAKRIEPWPLVMTAMDAPKADGVIRVSGLKDPELMALLGASGALASPSLLEGFGLPPLEAAVRGVPLLVSRIPAHVEALQDLEQGEAVWLDPSSQSAWTEAFHRAASRSVRAPSPQSRDRILERYSLRKMGEGVDRVYRRVLEI